MINNASSNNNFFAMGCEKICEIINWERWLSKIKLRLFKNIVLIFYKLFSFW